MSQFFVFCTHLTRLTQMLGVLFLACLLPGAEAQALTRVHLPMGEHIRRSKLILLVDISFEDKPKYNYILKVREVLYADDEEKVDGEEEVSVGETIKFDIKGQAGWYLPRAAVNVVVLFNTKSLHTSWPISEVYRQPEQIEALRQLLPIHALPTEREQILALQDQVKKTPAPPVTGMFSDELLSEFARMREPQNFDLVLASFEHLDAAHQASLLQLLGKINDQRALPLLISAIHSPDKAVRYWAIHSLTYRFPGAPGVTPALAGLLRDPETRLSVWSYIVAHAPQLTESIPPPPLTPWQKVHRLLNEKRIMEARVAYFAELENEKQLSSDAIYAAQSFLPFFNEQDKKRLKLVFSAQLGPYIKREPLSPYHAQTLLSVLRDLPSEQNIEPLLALLYESPEPQYSAWQEASRLATFALFDLGNVARQRGVVAVLQKLKARMALNVKPRYDEEDIYVCQLAWLADEAIWKKAMAELPDGVGRKMAGLQPLHDAANSKNEAAALASLLPDRDNKWQLDADKWIIARLGHLRDPIAVEPLFAEMERAPYSGGSTEISRALNAISGKPVEAAALKRLSSEEQSVKTAALRIFTTVQGERALPLLRGIVGQEGSGDTSNYYQQEAVSLLGIFGTPDDLQLLIPLTDFWKTHKLNYRAIDAVSSIRLRYNYDINGPVKPEVAEVPN
jgi:HEAT repeat protein